MTQSKPPRALEKADVVRILLDQEGRVMLCLDATCPGVSVPRRFASDHGLRLILNIQMPQPIHIGANAIESELRFGGIPHYCVIPYKALWGAYNPDTSHGVLWQDSMPEDILAQHHSFGESISWQEGLTSKSPPPEKEGAVTTTPLRSRSRTTAPKSGRDPQRQTAPVIPIAAGSASVKPKLQLVTVDTESVAESKSTKKPGKPSLKLVE
ncbi:MAG: hypothetical protein HQL60_01095 [Magnetococcales bacterium]|nr:hypothetical protein [Magnetococcales bacterium]